MKQQDMPGRIQQYAWLAAVLWTALTACSYAWYYHLSEKQIIDLAYSKAVTAFEQGRLYRRWVSHQGGVYVPASPETPPNPLLSHIPDRDITTPSGKVLTLVNATYMARQIFQFKELTGTEGRVHLTSLDPLNPDNRPDAWEARALQAFGKGVMEVKEVQSVNGRSYMRLMRVSFTEKACLKCHRAKGLKVGDVIGGFGVSVPISDILQATRPQMVSAAFSHGLIWLLGLAVLGVGSRRIAAGVVKLQASKATLRMQSEQLHREIRQRKAAQELLAEKVVELEATVDKVRQLEGILPICMYCKRIRDDKQSWNQLEKYISEHSEAQFSHGICPECAAQRMEEIKDAPR